MTNRHIAEPTEASRIFVPRGDIEPLPKVVNRVELKVSIETRAEVNPMIFDAEYTGLSYLLYLITLIIERVRAVKVYVAIEIAVIL